jgi:hypothetical protein
VVEGAGIECHIKNEFLYSGAGEIPPTETWPELWVDESDYDRSKALLDEALADKSDLPHWNCPACGEWVEGQFDLCWQCGTARPDNNQ